METHQGMYRSEHYLAWLMAAGAIVLALIGALVAFDIMSIRTIDLQDTGVTGTDATGNAIANFQDGVLLILPAIALGFLAMTLHTPEHHLQADSRKEGLWNAEHSLAYLGVLTTLAFVVLGILIGFDVFDNGNTYRDGVIWGLLAITSGALTATLHSVRHHAPAYDADDIRVIVEERVGRLEHGGVIHDRGVERL
jgi:hypothetical protein